ncbi:MAG: TIGR03752 family integrating conjugative element protein [Gammaproteobacteria bacterium]|nr:TIGR03752 family integrating conjugative element protein [Gammaproteobacteria bacterium]
MAVKQNTLLPVLGVLGLVIVGTILYQQFTSDGAEKPGDPIAQVPKPAPLPAEKGADGDNPTETLKSVVASNEGLRKEVQAILKRNEELEKGAATGHAVTKSAAESGTGELTMDAAGRAADNLLNGMPSFNGPAPKNLPGSQVGRVINAAPIVGDMALDPAEGMPGAVAYQKKIPLGFAAYEDTRNRKQGPVQTQYVRTMATSGGADGAAMQAGAGRGAAQARASEPVDEAYFTIPENATLVGVKAMTSIIGRVPIDGRVTDPMQFKAVVGRENLAANGWELPDDLAGMIVTGVAIGDMALSCSEGKIRSATFVFNDGTIRTVSSRARAGSGGGSGISGDLGFISDPHGNPCIAGKFVTNAPAYLTDIVGARTLGVAASAFADAAKLVTQNSSTGSTTTQITDTNRYVLGQAVSGASDEFTTWLLSRLKNSFDAVVTPSGHELVVHLDQELRLDKLVNARKLTHRQPASQTSTRGALYGLE